MELPSLPLPEMSLGSPFRSRTGRPTIGLFTYGGGDPCAHMVWAGVATVACEHDVNLICFPGKTLHSSREFEAQSNILYDLVNPDVIDGLVIWLAGLTFLTDSEETRAFCSRYRPLPLVTAGVLVEGIPGVAVDNYHGMKGVVSHLIEAHGRTRIAFIRGPERHQEAEDRFRGYSDALREHSLAPLEELVVLGDFHESGGVRAAQELLDQRGARFDALAAASDNMALGAMKVLQARGISVPDAVAVAAVNDEEQGRIVTPPLTTSPLHFYEQGQQAMEMVLTLLKGGTVPERVILPTRLLIRQSCGCPDPGLMQAAVEGPSVERAFPAAAAGTLADVLSAQHPALVAAMAPAVDGTSSDITRASVDNLLTAFADDLTETLPGRFLFTLDQRLRQTIAVGGDVSAWHEIISILRRQMLACLSAPAAIRRAENLWQQARLMIGETSQRAQAYQAWQAELEAQILGDINQALSTVLDVEELCGVLAESLPRLNVKLCYLSLYEKPEAPVERARLVLAHDRHGRIALPQEGLSFPSRQLVPAGWFPQDQCTSWVVEALYFRNDQLGFMLVEANPRKEDVYEILRGQISAALKRTLLAEHNVELYHEAVLARQVAEEGRRLAEEADCLKSRFLATVSHELRTPLTLIVGMIEMMLTTATDARGAAPASYQHDLTSIRSSAQHLARLIGDVLDLASSQAGELRLACEPVNLETILQEALALGEHLVREKGLRWRVEFPEALPTVWADRTRLKQVILNLISNATKFTDHGEVALTVVVEAKGVTVTVSDTGLGIPCEDQETIFDEFRQSDRSARRGYGGMGLGLAISRRLIELHGGQIGVRSSGEEGAGSAFFFTLPVMERVVVPQDMVASRKQTVMLLTEHAGSGERLRRHLTGHGFDVVEMAIESRPDWLTQVVAAPPGALVLDARPAEERGWELIKLLKQNPATQDMPVVFYALSEGQDHGTMLELDYLIKPAKTSELAQALERQGLGDKRRQRRPLILIVDDDTCILDLHARMLKTYLPDCRIARARNGREALEAMETEPPDMVLLDLMMPEVDGFTVLETMRQRERLRSVPVVVLTAQILTAPDMARLQHGVAAVLGKGVFSGAEVLTQIEAALARSKRLGNEGQRVARQAMAFIHEHYAEPITREVLAKHAGLSERHLDRCFHQETGMAVMAYLNRFRVQQAKAMLETSSQTVTEVAFAVGFSSINYFGRVFRQEVGASPSAYQRGERPAPESPEERG